MKPLRNNPYYPEFQNYIKRNKSKFLKGVEEGQLACRIKALSILLEWE